MEGLLGIDWVIIHALTIGGARTVDYVLCDKMFFANISKLLVLPPEFSSVHSPLYVTIKCHIQHNKLKTKLLPLPPNFIWDEDQREIFITLLNHPSTIAKLDNIRSCIRGEPGLGPSQIGNLLKEVSETLYNNASKCFKLKKKKGRHFCKPKGKPWFNSECVDTKKRLQNLAKLIVKHPTDPFIVGKYNLVKKQYRHLLKLSRRMYECESLNYLKKLTPHPKQFWKYLKNISGNKKSLSHKNYISPEVWIEHFSALNKSNPNDDRDSDVHVKNVMDVVADTLGDKCHTQACSILDKNFTHKEIQEGICKLKNGKASGCDGISNEIIKSASKSIVPVVCDIFNKLLELEHYPIQWATGLIIPLHKSGETDDPINFRGITINSCLSKLFTLLLNERLTLFCESNQIIEYNQVGFRKGFRTADQVFTLKTIIDQSFSRGDKLYACFVDFRKAYDTVWREALLYRLLQNGISGKFTNLIRDMYSRLQACVHLPNGISYPFPSVVGLKQGCNLSPILFNIFINNLVKDLQMGDLDAPKLGDISVSSLLYADDLVIISKSEAGLQKSLDILNEFSLKWKLKVNMTKTKCIVFSRGRKPATPLQMKLGHTNIENCDSYCYLGTMFSRSGSFNLASQTLCGKARSAMFSLLKNTYKHGACNIYLILELFDKMVSPIATYNSEVWDPHVYLLTPIIMHSWTLIESVSIQWKCYRVSLLKGY